MKDLGLEHGHSVQTPATHDATEEEPEPSDQVPQSKYRTQVTTCLLFSQDRADVTFMVHELCQRMSNTPQQSLAKLKRLGRCLKRDSNIQLWKDGRRSFSIFQVQIGQAVKKLEKHQAQA